MVGHFAGSTRGCARSNVATKVAGVMAKAFHWLEVRVETAIYEHWEGTCE